jgi:hypothetical protein
VTRVRKKSRVPVTVGGAAPTAESLSELLHDLQAIAETHPELYWKLYQLIGWLLLPDGFIWQQQGSRDWLRHRVARHQLESGAKWDDVFQSAADDLRNHPAAAGPDWIAATYKQVERKLPPELRRQKRRRGRPRRS